MIKCEKLGCIANLNGECVNDECKGEITQMPPCPCVEREPRRKYHEYIRGTFDKDFQQEQYDNVRKQMRSEGVCEEDIELTLNAIEELRRADNDTL